MCAHELVVWGTRSNYSDAAEEGMRSGGGQKMELGDLRNGGGVAVREGYGDAEGKSGA